MDVDCPLTLQVLMAGDRLALIASTSSSVSSTIEDKGKDPEIAFKKSSKESQNTFNETNTFTYSELNNEVEKICEIFLKKGFKKGDRLAVILPKSQDIIFIFLACLRVGVVFFPVNPKFPLSLRTEIFSEMDISNIIDENNVNQFFPEAIGDSAKIKSSDGLGKIKLKLYKYQLDQDVAIILTSGSSGRPKCAMFTFANLYYSALGSSRVIPLASTDAWQLSIPFYHIGGLSILWRVLLAGAALIVSEKQSFPHKLARRKITHVSWVHTHLKRFLENLPSPLPKYKAVLIGGGPCSDDLLYDGLRNNLPIYLSYGMTEMSSQVYTSKLVFNNEEIEYEGKVLPYRQLSFTKEKEILVRGETLFKGYVRRQSVFRDLTKEGWFATSDLGYMDNKKGLVLTGRKDNMFISGGENIQPEEIEKEILKLSGILNAIVVKKKDLEFGFRPIALIETDDPEVNEEELKEHLKAVLPFYMIPIKIVKWAGVDEDSLKANRSRLEKWVEEKL